MSLFDVLPNEIVQKILYCMSNKNLFAINQTDNKFYQIIDENFLKNKLFNDDPIAYNLKPNGISFKQYSLDLYHRVKHFPVYFDDKLVGYVLISVSDTICSIHSKIHRIDTLSKIKNAVITVKLSSFRDDRFCVLWPLNKLFTTSLIKNIKKFEVIVGDISFICPGRVSITTKSWFAYHARIFDVNFV